MITKKLLENNSDDCDSVGSYNDNIYFLVLFRDRGLIKSNVYGIIVRYDEIPHLCSKSANYFRKHSQFKFTHKKINIVHPVDYRNKNIGSIHWANKYRMIYNARDNSKVVMHKEGLPALVKISITNSNGDCKLFKNGDYAWNAERKQFYQNYHFLHNVRGFMSIKNLAIVNKKLDTFVEVLKLNKQMLAVASLNPFTHIQSFVLGCSLILNI